MEGDLLIVSLSFAGALCLGTTAVLLKKAHVDSVYYGLIIRALGSAPLMLLLTVILQGPDFLLILLDPVVMLPTTLAALALIGADILIMSILKRKPVGIIAPIMSVFPLFTTTLLIITGHITFSLPIIGFTALIVVGVGLVTYDRSIDEDGNQVAPFDLEAMLYGITIAFLLGLTNYFDVIVLKQDSEVDGLGYTSLKFFMLLVLSVIAYSMAKETEWKVYRRNVSSTIYLVFAGFIAWALGGYLIYTAYDDGDPEIVNAIIGTNPVFAVLVSLGLGMEDLNIQKIIGLLCCVIASIGIVNL